MSDGVAFVETLPEELRCPFHLGVFDDPVVGSCGHSFCRVCVETAPIPTEDDDEFLKKPAVIEEGMCCPICNSAIVFPLFPNLILTAIISQLRVYCRFRNRESPEEGCKVQTELGALSTHEASCMFAKDGKKKNRQSLTISSPQVPLQLSWKIDFREVKLLYRVGIGAFGEVFKASFRGTFVAAKRIIAKRMSEEERMELFNRELSFVKSIRHPNIVLFIGACLQKDNLCILTEFMGEGSLRDNLEEDAKVGAPPDWDQYIQWALDAASAMAYLHGEHIIHRDIKSNNLLISGGQLKVADFGLAKVVGCEQMSQAGNWAWMAPEILRGEKDYTEKVDVYSFGIVLAEILTVSPAEELPRTPEMTLDIQALKSMASASAPAGLLKLVQDSCVPEPALRPEFSTIVSILKRIKLNMRASPCSDPIKRRKRTSSGSSIKRSLLAASGI